MPAAGAAIAKTCLCAERFATYLRTMRSSFIIAGAIALGAGLWIASGQFGGDPAQDAVAAVTPEAPAESADAPTVPADATATTAAAPMRVQVMDSVAQPREKTIVLRGRTDADRVVEVSAETVGKVDSILAEEGARIAAGQVIAEIDGADRLAKLAEAKALLQQREEEWTATSQLSEKGFSPKLSLPDLKAKLALSRAAVTSMEVEIGYLSIKAPIDGVLEDRPVEIGKYLKEGDPVATIVDLDPIIIVGSVSELEIDGIKLGSPATARLITGQTIAGTIRFIASAADEVTRTFRIEIAAPNPDYAIRQGISAEIRVPGAAQAAHVVSPAVLTLDASGAVGVKLVGADNAVSFAPVEIVGEDQSGVWITGLPDPARIVTVGQDFVSVGQVVEPVPMPVPVLAPVAAPATP